MIKGKKKMYWQLVMMSNIEKTAIDAMDTEEFYEAYAALQEINKDMKPKKGGP